MKIIGSPKEKTIPVGYVYYPKGKAPVRYVTYPGEKEKAPVRAEAGINWEKYIPWVIVGLITHVLVSSEESKK